MESRASKADPAEQQAGDEASPGAPQLTEVVANVGDRVQEILDAAERMAADIRADAARAGERLLEERRAEADQAYGDRLRELQRITRSLSTRTATVQREVAALVAELEDVTNRLQRVSGVDPLSAVLAPAADDPKPVAYPGTAAHDPRPEQQAALRATQMAVAGSERSEIERMLRDDYGVEDPAAAVDRMLRSEPA